MKTEFQTVGTCAFAVVLLVMVGCGDSASSPTEARLRILVTNDDGVAAHGIDALVEALIEDDRNEVTVCAPNGNRSGSGDMTGPSQRCGDLSVETSSTLSGYPAVAIDRCPADAVNYAIASLYSDTAPPHVVLSGINEGQNVSEVISMISGTVGAALTAARREVPALASSQGIPGEGGEFDYPAGVRAVLTWLEDHRASLAAHGVGVSSIDSLNIPSCDAGSIRGTVDVPLAASAEGAIQPQDCLSTLEDPATDVEALNNGFISQASVPIG